MSIYGIGVDLLNYERVSSLWEQYGEKFSKRILSDLEKERLSEVKRPDIFIAKCFAIKEAFAKALGTGFRKDVYLTDISYTQNYMKKPDIMLVGNTKKYFDSLGDLKIHLSITDEPPHICAYVIIEKN